MAFLLTASTVAVSVYYYIFYMKVTPRTKKYFIINVNDSIEPLPADETPDFPDPVADSVYNSY